MPLNSMDGLTAAIIGAPTTWGKAAVTAAAAGTPHTPWYAAGIVGAGAAPTGALNGANFTGPSVAGQIGLPAAVAGANSVLLKAIVTQTGNVGGLWLVDRLWGNVPVVTTTGAQAVTQPTLPPRDASASTAGVGVFLALETSAAAANPANPATTVSYTNSAGVSGRTATLLSYPANAPQGTFVPLALQAGDVGVRSVQSITLGNSYVSGQVNLIAYRLVCELPPGPTANVAAVLGYTQLLKPPVWDASVLQLVYIPTGTAIGTVYGSFTYAQG